MLEIRCKLAEHRVVLRQYEAVFSPARKYQANSQASKLVTIHKRMFDIRSTVQKISSRVYPMVEDVSHNIGVNDLRDRPVSFAIVDREGMTRDEAYALDIPQGLREKPINDCIRTGANIYTEELLERSMLLDKDGEHCERFPRYLGTGALINPLLGGEIMATRTGLIENSDQYAVA